MSVTINGNFNLIYSFILLVVLLPVALVLKDDDGRIISKSKEQMNLQSYTIDEKYIKDFSFSLEDAGKQTYTLAETLRKTLSEFEELFKNILNIVSTNVPKISRDAEIFLSILSNYTMNVLSTFSNKILKEGDNIFTEIFSNFERQLESVSLEFQNLATNVDEHFNWAVAQLNLTLINSTEEYDWWTAHVKQKLRTLNDTKLYQEGCRAIDAFITNSTKELHNCCKITMKPMRSLCKSANSLIAEALHTIVDSIDKMQACLEEKNSYLDFMLPCIDLAYDEVTSLVSRAAQISHQVNNMLPMKIIYTKSCFAIVKVEMSGRRNDIESNFFL